MSTSTTDTVRIVLLAFLGGLAVPILVQLFLTLRTLQRVSLSVERRMDETSRELTSVLAGLRREGSGGPDVVSLIASAAVPAVLAAVRAFRAPASNLPVPNGAAHHQNTEEKTS
jgi:hypothetical protein